MHCAYQSRLARPHPSVCLRSFVAVERGAVSYPTYPIHRIRPVFSSRQQVLEYEQALCLAAQVDAALEVRATYSSRYTSTELVVCMCRQQDSVLLGWARELPVGQAGAAPLGPPCTAHLYGTSMASRQDACSSGVELFTTHALSAAYVTAVKQAAQDVQQQHRTPASCAVHTSLYSFDVIC